MFDAQDVGRKRHCGAGRRTSWAGITGPRRGVGVRRLGRWNKRSVFVRIGRHGGRRHGRARLRVAAPCLMLRPVVGRALPAFAWQRPGRLGNDIVPPARARAEHPVIAQ